MAVVDDALVDYGLSIVEESRRSPHIAVGVSTRGALAWYRAAQAHAFADGRDFCVPDDWKQLAVPALAHRITLPAAHDSLGDAYHTALVCQKLRLAEGIAAYEAAVQAHENGFHGAELPGCLARSVHHGYETKTQLLAAMSGRENRCPECGGPVRPARL